MANAYPVNNYPTVRATFGIEKSPPTVPPTYVNTDPTALTVKTVDPAGAAILYTLGVDSNLFKEAVGMYAVRFKLTSDGPWVCHWNATFADGTSSSSESSLTALPARTT